MIKKKIDSNTLDYIKFWLQSAFKAPVGKKEMDAIANGKRLTSIVRVGEDYVLLVEARIVHRSEVEDE